MGSTQRGSRPIRNRAASAAEQVGPSPGANSALLAVREGSNFRAIHRPGTNINRLREQQCRGYIAAVFRDRPDLAAALTPRYPFPGKRPILTGQFYPCLLREDVQLVPHSVIAVTPTGVVDAEGLEHQVDVLIMATGFQPANYLASYDVVGRAGLSFRDVWRGEPKAFLGMTVPEFPNFYILYGPNTNGGEIVSHLERQARYAVRSIKRLRRGDVLVIEVRASFFRWYNQWIQRAISKTAWVRSNNYYKAESGRVVTQWPYGVVIYSALIRLLGRATERQIRRSPGETDRHSRRLIDSTAAATICTSVKAETGRLASEPA